MSDDRSSKKRRLEEGADHGGNADQVNRLTSLLPASSTGGLQGRGGLQKPNQKPHDEHKGKSLLGLDRLADDKRQEKEERQVQSKAKFKAKSKTSSHKQKRHFRQRSSEDSPERRSDGRRIHDTNSNYNDRRRPDQSNNNRGRPNEKGYSDQRHEDRRNVSGGRYDKNDRRGNYDGRDSTRDRKYDDRERDRGRGDYYGGKDRGGPNNYFSHSNTSSRETGGDDNKNYRERGGNNHHFNNKNTNYNRPQSDLPRQPRQQHQQQASQRPSQQEQPQENSSPSKLSRESNKNRGNEGTSSKEEPKNDITYDSDGTDFDRQFYLAEDEGGYVVDTSEMEAQGHLGRFLFVNEKIKAREAEMEKRRRNPMLAGKGGQQQQGQQQRFMSARQSALMDDQEAWEENRLLSSGAASRGKVDLDVSNENDSRVTLLVHQIKPPFLEKSSAGFLEQKTAVATVKDNSSDFCKMAREGSVTLQRLRQEKDKAQFRQKFWELGGTKMGNAIGVKKEEPTPEPDSQQSSAPAEENADGEVDYKKSSGYASHVSKHKQEAVSEFAKSKSIRQQREFLPIFSVRDELLNVIRENNVVVAVGETGSGKTTQLVQYLLEEGYCSAGAQVGCTQPRRVAAMSVAKRVSEEVSAAVKEKGHPLTEKDELGGTVGYAIRFEDCTTEHTK